MSWLAIYSRPLGYEVEAQGVALDERFPAPGREPVPGPDHAEDASAQV